MPSICCVKSIRKLVVPSAFAWAGVFCLRGVGEGEREGEGRLRVVCGVAGSLPGVRTLVFVGLWPSLAKSVISGISEKVLKQVSSMLETS